MIIFEVFRSSMRSPNAGGGGGMGDGRPILCASYSKGLSEPCVISKTEQGSDRFVPWC